MTRTNDKGLTKRITVEALRYYVPLFQEGDRAEEKLLKEGDTLSPGERNHLEAAIRLKELAVLKIADLSGPLITKELNKIISTSHLKTRDDLYSQLYYAGIDGMKRGLRRFDVAKINTSSTNYLFQWIVTYAKKELIMLEAPFGIPPSRFQKYKKISAVRKQLSEKYKRYATNEDVYAHFQSGGADYANMNGRVANRNKPSQANLNISIELIQEQEQFEKKFLTVDLLDPSQDYSSDIRLSRPDDEIWSETVFGAFCDSYNVTDEARVVIMSELGNSNVSLDDITLLQSIPQNEFKTMLIKWRNLIKDVNGPFYSFLLKNKSESFAGFDMNGTIVSIESYDKAVNSESYLSLFVDQKIEVS
jgi:hypothetical protein